LTTDSYCGGKKERAKPIKGGEKRRQTGTQNNGTE